MGQGKKKTLGKSTMKKTPKKSPQDAVGTSGQSQSGSIHLADHGVEDITQDVGAEAHPGQEVDR